MNKDQVKRQCWAVPPSSGLTDALIGLGIPEVEDKRYEGKINRGSALISDHTASSNERDKAKEVFERAHAADISSTERASA